MLNDQTSSSSTSTTQERDAPSSENFRDIHPLTPPPSAPPGRRGETWETSSHRSSNPSIASTENFATMSREFNALVLAGSTAGNHGSENDVNSSSVNNLLSRIGEEEDLEEMNRLAIVPDNNPVGSPGRRGEVSASVSVQRVKKEEVETKIGAWQNEKVAEINNRFKREEAIINGWEDEQVQKATLCMKKVERKLEEKRAKAQEKMQNEIAKAHRKAEERRASAEAKRGTKVARLLEVANLMRAVGRAPAKRSFF